MISKKIIDVNFSFQWGNFYSWRVDLEGERIILPDSLQARDVAIAHEGHQGLKRVKSFLRTKIWFPNMGEMVQDAMNKCMAADNWFGCW